MTDESPFQRIRYERADPAVIRIVLARPETRNAQDKQMLYELNDAFDRAAADETVRVIILAADGPHFSSGHDLRDLRNPMSDHDPVGTWREYEKPAAEGYLAIEQEIYLGLCWRWRNIPKPTIAEVHGKVIAGGLMLVWPCDLIVASDDAEFSDPVVALGVNGCEYFVHPYELGARKAKEMLFTGRAISATEAAALGMVNKVVPRARLKHETLELARTIAARPSFALKLAKMSVNHAEDAQGMWATLQAALGWHHLGHAHNREVHGKLIDPSGVGTIRRGPKTEE